MQFRFTGYIPRILSVFRDRGKSLALATCSEAMLQTVRVLVVKWARLTKPNIIKAERAALPSRHKNDTVPSQ